MSFKKTVLFASIVIQAQLSFAQDAAVRRLSLEEALNLADRHSYQVQVALSQLEQAKGRNLESWSGFLPRVSVSENYIKSNDPVTVFSLKLKQGIFSESDFNPGTLNSPPAIDNFTTALRVQQPLLNIDAIYGRAAAQSGVDASKYAAERVREAVAFEVKRAYYGLVLARENLRAIDGAVRSAQSHRDNARAAFGQGLINQADMLAAEVRLAELQEQRISAQHQIMNASDGLRFVIGIEEEANIVPSDSLLLRPTEPAEETLAGLAERRSDLRALRSRLRAANRNLWMKRSGWLPRLNGFAAVEWNASEAFSKDASNWSVGLQLEWQIFEGFGKVGRAKQAAARKEEATVQQRQAEERARLEVRQARRAMESARQRIEVTQTAVEQAEESLRIVEARFSQGLEKVSDLLDKEVARTNARLRLLQARHDYAVAVGQLELALGI